MEIMSDMSVEEFLVELMCDRMKIKKHFKRRIANDKSDGFRITGVFSYYNNEGTLINSELFVDSINNVVIEKNKKEIYNDMVVKIEEK